MKKIILAVVVLAIAGGGYFYFMLVGGSDASELEQTYLTENDRFVEISGARVRVRAEGAADTRLN